MIIGAFFSFFGSTAFRWLFGEVIGFLKAKQDHEHEMAMIRLNLDVEKERAELRKAEIAAAAEAGVKVIEAQAEAAHDGLMDQAWLSAVQGIDKPSGVAWIDGFNKLIRPELAQVSILLIIGNALWPQHVVLQGIVMEVICGALGLFLGGRITSTGR
jgi:hypothetical protein